MTITNSLVKLATLGIAVFSVAGVAHAQSVTLTTATWNTLSAPTVVGTPAFTTNLSAAANGAFAPSATLTLPGTPTANVSFSPSNFTISILNSGGLNVSTGTATGNFTIATTTGNASFNVPISYTVTDQAAGISSALVNITATPVDFSIGGDTFRFAFGPINGAYADNNTAQAISPVPATITFLSSGAPEPATMALFGLGIVPVAVAIRRRRK